jgi:hypothetical protein
VGAHHRTLATYLIAAAGVGLVLDQVREPPANGSLAERSPWYTQVPAILLVRWHTLRTGGDGPTEERRPASQRLWNAHL